MKKCWIPNTFTFMNLCCGVLSILSTFEHKYFNACIFILIAALVDRYDGRIARFLDVSSEIGKELDSLADLVSFGVAPSILAYIFFNFNVLGHRGIIGYILVLIFPLCGAFRLARYNISTFNGVYTGIPITIAGLILTILILIATQTTISIAIPISFICICSYLMVSNVTFKKV